MSDLFNSPTLKAIRALENSPAMRSIRAIEDSRALRMIRMLDESPVLSLMRQIEKFPAIKTIRDLENFSTLKATGRFEESTVFKGTQHLQEPPVLKALLEYQTSPAIKAFSRIADQVSYSYGAFKFLEAYELVEDEYKKQTDPEPLDVLSTKLQERAGFAPRSALSAEFYLNLMVALIFFYLSYVSTVELEEKMLVRFNSLEQKIADQLRNLNELERDQSFLVADRSNNLRSGPGDNHEIISGITRNQKLLVLERDRDWVKVEYFDYVNNKNIAGCAHSRYLLVIPTISQE